MKKLFGTTIVVGLLSLVSFVFERLALTDIFHGEPDLSLEWTIVNAALIPLVVFHILGVVSAVFAFRNLGRSSKGDFSN